MKRKTNLFYQGVALCLAFFMAGIEPAGSVSILAQMAPAASSADSPVVPEILSELNIPADLGEIEEIYSPPFGSGKKASRGIILIQDAHAIPDAQNSIKKLIEFLHGNHGARLVGLEGTAGPLDGRLFQTFPDNNLLQEVFAEFEAGGEIPGAVLACAYGPASGLDYYGIEDPALYEENIHAYLKSLAVRDRMGSLLKEKMAGLEELKRIHYPPALLKFDGLAERFERQQSGWEAFFSELEAFLDGHQRSVDSRIYPNLAVLLERFKPQTAEELLYQQQEIRSLANMIEKRLDSYAERQEFHGKRQAYETERLAPEEFMLYLMEMNQKKSLPLEISAHLQTHLDQYRFIRNMAGPVLFEEIRDFIRRTRDSFSENEEVRAVANISRRLILIEKLLKLELSKDEFNEVSDIRGPGGQTAFPGRSLPADIRRLDSRVRGLWELREAAVFFEFYDLAQKREKAMLRRMQELLARKEQTLMVAVAGGFHREGLSALFQEEGMAYAVITPRIRALPQHNRYLEHMTGQVSWKNYFKPEGGRINVYEAFSRAAVDRLILAYEKKRLVAGRGFLLKKWRENIIRKLATEERLHDAGRYTRFIDEILLREADPGRQEMMLGAWAQRVSDFLESLRELSETGKLDSQNILSLLRPSTAAAWGPSMIFSPERDVPAGWLREPAEAQSVLRPVPVESEKVPVPDVLTAKPETPMGLRFGANDTARGFLFGLGPVAFSLALRQVTIRRSELRTDSSGSVTREDRAFVLGVASSGAENVQIFMDALEAVVIDREEEAARLPRIKFGRDLPRSISSRLNGSTAAEQINQILDLPDTEAILAALRAAFHFEGEGEDMTLRNPELVTLVREQLTGTLAEVESRETESFEPLALKEDPEFEVDGAGRLVPVEIKLAWERGGHEIILRIRKEQRPDPRRPVASRKNLGEGWNYTVRVSGEALRTADVRIVPRQQEGPYVLETAEVALGLRPDEFPGLQAALKQWLEGLMETPLTPANKQLLRSELRAADIDSLRTSEEIQRDLLEALKKGSVEDIPEALLDEIRNLPQFLHQRIAINLKDAGALFRKETGTLTYEDSLNHIRLLLPLLRSQGVGQVYLYGGLFEMGEAGLRVHRGRHGWSKKHPAQPIALRDGKTLITVQEYPTKKTQYTVPPQYGPYEKPIEIEDSHNPFSILSMLLWNPHLSASEGETGSSQKTENLMRQLVKEAHALGMKVTLDFFPWLAPDAIDETNYHLTFFNEISNEENAAFRDLSEEGKLKFMEELVKRHPGGVFAVRIAEPGRNREKKGEIEERVILVHHLKPDGGGLNVDQAVLNPFLPEVQDYLLKSMQKLIDAGADEVRADLAHVLLRDYILNPERGYFSDYYAWSFEQKTGRSVWDFTHENGELVEPWKEIISKAKAYAQSKGKAIEFKLETYEDKYRERLAAFGGDRSYYKEVFDDMVKAARGGPVHYLAGSVRHVINNRGKLIVFPSNYDQLPMVFINGAPKAMTSLMHALTFLGADVMWDLRDWLWFSGHAFPMVGGSLEPGSLDQHPFAGQKEFETILDFEKFLEAVYRAPAYEVMQELLENISPEQETYIEMLDNARTDRFMTLGWKNKSGDWHIFVADFRPGAEGALEWVDIPREALRDLRDSGDAAFSEAVDAFGAAIEMDAGNNRFANLRIDPERQFAVYRLSRSELRTPASQDPVSFYLETEVIDVKTGRPVAAVVRDITEESGETLVAYWRGQGVATGVLVLETQFEGAAREEGRLVWTREIYEGRPMLYVMRIESAPENRRAAGEDRRFRFVGARLLQAAVQISRILPETGGAYLKVLPENAQAEAFYRRFEPLGWKAVEKKGIIFWFMEPEDAERFIQGTDKTVSEASRRSELRPDSHESATRERFGTRRSELREIAAPILLALASRDAELMNAARRQADRLAEALENPGGYSFVARILREESSNPRYLRIFSGEQATDASLLAHFYAEKMIRAAHPDYHAEFESFVSALNGAASQEMKTFLDFHRQEGLSFSFAYRLPQAEAVRQQLLTYIRMIRELQTHYPGRIRADIRILMMREERTVALSDFLKELGRTGIAKPVVIDDPAGVFELGHFLRNARKALVYGLSGLPLEGYEERFVESQLDSEALLPVVMLLSRRLASDPRHEINGELLREIAEGVEFARFNGRFLEIVSHLAMELMYRYTVEQLIASMA